MRIEHGLVTALVWEADKVKTRRPHEVPLVGRAQDLVQVPWAARRLDTKLVFHVDGKPLGLLRSEWNAACAKAALPAGRMQSGYVIHPPLLSHEPRRRGVPDTVARSISGHRTPAVHARYQITQQAAQRDALEAMTARVTQLDPHGRNR